MIKNMGKELIKKMLLAAEEHLNSDCNSLTEYQRLEAELLHRLEEGEKAKELAKQQDILIGLIIKQHAFSLDYFLTETANIMDKIKKLKASQDSDIETRIEELENKVEQIMPTLR